MARLASFLLLAALLTATLTAWAHAFHASILDVRYNRQKQQLELALKVFTDDLEQALSAGQPAAVSLGQSPPPLVRQLVSALLRKNVAFSTQPGQTLPLHLLGIQKENDAHWLYGTVPVPRQLAGVRLRHTLLLGQFADQLNIVNVEAAGRKQSLLFRHGAEVQDVKW